MSAEEGAGSDQLDTPAGQNDWARPMFRTISLNSVRHAVRLEQVFWDAIARLSARKQVKPADYARELMQISLPSGTNLSSGLRSAVVRQLLDQDLRLASLAEPLATVKLLQLAPTPSFALDRNKQLVRVNDEFVRYLRTAMTKSGPPEKAQLRLDRSVDTIFKELSGAAFVECGVSIIIANHEWRTEAKVIAPPPFPANILVGFILR